ncbi:Methyl farnesoate epoxidase [Orchesella cincta]|uniref:Methyl farnesoate epoxidase n=1 Tax=Orchesella cincta TaxID=48709 RepID=A0A1D2MPB2_ORCCI|nr:Methyl farnesoate epoxidase [Orchesella cincta]
MENVTVVTDYRLIIDNLKKDEFQGRPDFGLWEDRNSGKRNRGVLLCDGPVWQEQRRFVLRGLRDFGFGKESMEGMLIHELQELQNTLKNDIGHPVSLAGVFNASVLNSLWHIVTGNRFELTDPTLKNLIKLLIEVIGYCQFEMSVLFKDTSCTYVKLLLFCSNVSNLLITTPALFFYWPVKNGLMGRKMFKSSLKFREDVRLLLQKVIDEHWDTYKEGEARDFVDAYIEQIKATNSDSSSFYSEEGSNTFLILWSYCKTVASLAETTSTTLQWAALYSLTFPECRRRFKMKLTMSLDDLDLQAEEINPAVLNEVHRMCSLIPVSVYHKAVQDSEIGGYFIPKNSVVFFSIYDAHHDAGYWGDPNSFRPERFLDKSETKLIRHEPLIPFSSGKRQCLGETLARDTLFLFFAGLLQTFTFEIDPVSSNNDLKGTPSFISAPKPFKVILKERK